MEPDTQKHIEEERLEAYVMNYLAEAEIPALEEHLLICETCLDQLEAVEGFARAMEGAAKRIRMEETDAAAIPGAWDRVRAWLHTPAPIWAGALAMAVLITLIRLQLPQPPGPPVEVELEAVRGPSNGIAPSGHALHLRLDSRGVPDSSGWQIEIVDQEGSGVWTGAGSWSGIFITASVDKSFRPGTYFVRLLKEGEEPVREFKLVVQEAGP